MPTLPRAFRAGAVCAVRDGLATRRARLIARAAWIVRALCIAACCAWQPALSQTDSATGTPTPSQATPSQATLSQATPSQATPSQATLSQATPSQATPGQANPTQANTGVATTRMDEMVITASRLDETLRDTIPHTTVLTAEDIRAAQVPDVVTLLRREAGIEIAQNGGIGHVAGLFVRGGNTNQTLVLVDGMRLNTATTGTAAIDQILVDQIDRIEIVRGDVSALYGSEAMSGVVQIFTKRGTGTPNLSAAIGAGGQGMRNAQASYGGETAGGTQFNVGWSVFHNIGFSALNTNVSPTVDGDADGYSNQTISASISQRIGELHTIGASFFRSDGRADFDDAFAASPNDKQKDATRVGVWQAFWDAQFLPTWHSHLSGGSTTDYLQDYLNANPVDQTTQHNTSATWQNDVTIFRETTLTAGLDYLRQSVDSTTAYDRTERTSDSAFIQLKSILGRNQFQLAGRYAHYSDFGTHNTYYLGYGFLVTEAIKLTASESTGFRAPTFNELFFPNFGNPNLGPETVRTSELGAQWAVAQHLLRLAAFSSRYSNLIASTPATGFELENIAKAEVRGIELTYRGHLFTIDWVVSGTLQRPWDISNDAQLIRRARAYADVAASRSFGPVRVGLDWHVSGPKQDVDPVSLDRLQVAGYGVLDATLAYQLAKAWKLGLSGLNLFNKDYTLVQGYNTQPRTIMLSLAYRPQ